MSVYRLLGVFTVLTLLALAGWWLARAPVKLHAVPAEAGFVPESTESAVTPIPASLPLDGRKVALGKRLFHDTRLSRDNSVACATCHDLGKHGHDGRPVAVGIDGQLGTLNSPTVFNAAFNFRQFWDGRVATLEEQAEGPVHNPIEMASNWREVMNKLSHDREMLAEFKAIWPDGINPSHIQNAIAEFERSLITPDSPFDRYLRGDVQALDAKAQAGWRLFRDLGCIACHQGVNLGGNLYANIGVMADFFSDRGLPVKKSDLGRFNVTGRPEDKFVFKVPGLRNIAKTGPYLHDGSIQSLTEAIEAIAWYQLGAKLSKEETQNLLAFLESLTGQYQGKPL
jgi:cytochrome c peroxidase